MVWPDGYVLPTGVDTSLPFACNAPFLQDPGRVKIRDPESSRTNQWLLERVGKLAASVMLRWVGTVDLPMVDRAAAYECLPYIARSSLRRGDNSIEASCTSTIAEAFDESVRDEQFLLTESGSLAGACVCVVVPAWLLEVWTAKQVADLLDLNGSPIFSLDVEEDFKKALIDQDYLLQRTGREVAQALTEKHPKRPDPWDKLIALWNGIAQETRRSVVGPQFELTSLRIVPIQSRVGLYAAEDVVRLGERWTALSDEDWEFLARHLRVLNRAWLKHLAERRRASDSDHEERERVEVAFDVLRRIGLSEPCNAAEAIDQVARRFSEQDEVPTLDCIRLAQIAAALDVTVSDAFEFVIHKGTRTSRSLTSSLVADTRLNLDAIVPEAWYSEHLLAADYWENFTSCTRDEWRQWINSGHSGLLQFIPIESQELEFRSKQEFEEELQKRGFNPASLPYAYAAPKFTIEDWDFAPEVWDHWKAIASGDHSFWAKLLARVIEQAPSYWNKCLEAAAFQVTGWKPRVPLDIDDLLPSWILKLQSKACLQDNRGYYREPAELLCRTAATEVLIDREPFVRAELDTEAVRPLLRRLGVRDTPTGPEGPLKRLRALATVTAPPVDAVRKWCHHLDVMFSNCSTAQTQEITTAFKFEKLIPKADGTWARAEEVFWGSDELRLPGSAAIHADLRHFTLWQRIGVPQGPTIEMVLAWLRALPKLNWLSADELRRVKEVLPRYPHQIWSECGCWLNLAGEWSPVDELAYFSKEPADEWNHLFAPVRRQVADFAQLPTDVISQLPFCSLPSLASRLEQRVKHDTDEPAHGEPWLNALGDGLSRIEGSTAEEPERIREQGDRLAKTVWQTTKFLETTPYLDGTPAGTATPREVLWKNRTLFVRKRPIVNLFRPLAQELARAFDDPAIADAIRFCIGRRAEEVAEYLKQNFEIPVGETGNDHDPERSGDSTGANGDQNGPTRDMNRNKRGGGQPADPTRTLIECFARLNGFEKAAAEDCFCHVDGRSMRRTHPTHSQWAWEIYSADRILLNCLFVKNHPIAQIPLEVDAELWEACRREPSKYSLVLVNHDGSPLELSGRCLVDLAKSGGLEIYPARYRLFYRENEARVEEPA